MVYSVLYYWFIDWCLEILSMTERFNMYYCRQKDWWQNMNNTVINYRHMSEAILDMIHMSTPKQRIDRMRAI